MEKSVVNFLLIASISAFAVAIILVIFARPSANQLVTALGLVSAALAVVALAMFVGFKLAEIDGRR